MKTNYGKKMNKLKIVVATFQVVLSTATVCHVTLPAAFTRFTEGLTFLNLNFAHLFPVSCAIKLDYMGILLVATVGPLIVTGLLVVCLLLESVVWTGKVYGKSLSKEEKTFQLMRMAVRYLDYWFYLTYLILPSVSTTIFQAFICTDIDPNNEYPGENKYYLTADMSISCQSDYYRSWRVYAAFMILVYPLGIPLSYFLVLYKNRREISTRQEIVQNAPDDTKLSMQVAGIAFLWQAYRPNAWYWEVVETTRRILLTAVLSVASPGTSQQSVLSILLALLYIKLYSIFHPYASKSDDIMAEMGQWQIFFTFFVANTQQNDLLPQRYQEALGALLIFVNLGVLYFPLLTYLFPVTFEGQNTVEEGLASKKYEANEVHSECSDEAMNQGLSRDLSYRKSNKMMNSEKVSPFELEAWQEYEAAARESQTLKSKPSPPTNATSSSTKVVPLISEEKRDKIVDFVVVASDLNDNDVHSKAA